MARGVLFTERLWRSVKYEEAYLKDYASPKADALNRQRREMLLQGLVCAKPQFAIIMVCRCCRWLKALDLQSEPITVTVSQKPRNSMRRHKFIRYLM